MGAQAVVRRIVHVVAFRKRPWRISAIDARMLRTASRMQSLHGPSNMPLPRPAFAASGATAGLFAVGSKDDRTTDFRVRQPEEWAATGSQTARNHVLRHHDQTRI